MEQVYLLEFEDLSESLQRRVKDRYMDDLVYAKVEQLGLMYTEGEITEEEYYEELGADKAYADTVPWFFGSIYYDNHQDEIEGEIDKGLNNFLFTKSGKMIRRDDTVIQA